MTFWQIIISQIWLNTRLGIQYFHAIQIIDTTKYACLTFSRYDKLNLQYRNSETRV